MDATIASNFIENISKHIQLLLRHYIPFEHQVEVMGHLNINVDLNTRVNCIVSEKCEKDKDSEFRAISTSFHVSPDPSSTISLMSTHSSVRDQELQTPLPTPPFKRPKSTPVRRSPIKRLKIKCVRESPSTSTDSHGDEEQTDYSQETDDTIAAVNEPSSGWTITQNEDDEGEDDNESLMSDVSVSGERLPDDGVEYTIIEYGTQMGKPLLVDNIGYSYNLRRPKELLDKERILWRCSKRSQRLKCSAAVSQKGDRFTTGPRPHEHPPQRGMLTSALIYAEIRNQALLDFETPVPQIVARAMSIKGADDDESVLPKAINLRRMLQRFRNSQRAMKIIDDNK